jgi:hypothetical protein
VGREGLQNFDIIESLGINPSPTITTQAEDPQCNEGQFVEMSIVIENFPQEALAEHLLMLKSIQQESMFHP